MRKFLFSSGELVEIMTSDELAMVELFRPFDDRMSASMFLQPFFADPGDKASISEVYFADMPAFNPLAFPQDDADLLQKVAERMIHGSIRIVAAGVGPVVGPVAAEADAGGGGAAAPAEAEKKKPKNRVTPKVQVEYKLVLLDKRLHRHQAAGETKIKTSPTYVLLSMKEHKAAPAYDKGGKVSVSPANVDLFTDEACTTPFNTATTLTKAQLTKGKGYKLWLRGKTAGKFKIKLTLEASARNITIDPPAEEEMGVVELGLEVHEYVQAAVANAPTLSKMSDTNKVSKGRIVHAQSKNKDHDRVKVVLKKLNPAHLPAGCDDYTIMIGSGGAPGLCWLFDAQKAGSKKKLPHKLKVSDLKAADKTFWVEGRNSTKKLRDLRLDVGLDRAKGGLAKKPKRNGDWARFTVVWIKHVKPSTEFKKKTRKYRKNKFRHYINLKVNPAGGYTLTTDADGRKIKLKAQLSQKIKDVTIHFMWVANANNRKAANIGTNLPGTWSQGTASFKTLLEEDKAAATNYFHKSIKTDAKGIAEVELRLSRFGGDIFLAGAYIFEDPHLAVYDPTDAVKKKRVPTLSKRITCYRKFWYQLTRQKNSGVPIPSHSPGLYGRVRAEMIKSNVVDFLKAGAPAQTFYPEWMFKKGSNSARDVAVIGSHNKAHFLGLYVAEAKKPLKANIVVCEYQFDEDGSTGVKTFDIDASPTGWLDVGKPVVKPPLQGGNLVVAASGTWATIGVAPAQNGVLTDANIIITKPRNDLTKVKIKLPAGAPVPTAAAKIRVSFNLQAASGPWLGENDAKDVLAVYDKSTAIKKRDYHDTVSHEIGHGFAQTPTAASRHASLPNHPNQYLSNGSHCNFGAKKCVMYESGPQATAIHRYCEKCHPYMSVEDMTKFR